LVASSILVSRSIAFNNSFQPPLRLNKTKWVDPFVKHPLLTDVAEQLQSKPEETAGIFELQGLGKEIWAGVDVEKYLDQERSSWNG
jgi:hypothetical protein